MPDEFIKAIQAECYEVDDDLRWLLALIVDTGMRLAEAVGLKTEDIKLDSEVPSVKVSPYRWRRLKTRSSEREVPLVGSALWA